MSTDRYHIAAILNEYEIVINAGFNEGLSKGDKIEIFEMGEDIIDVANNDENLGPLLFIKDTLKIVFVDEKYSICQKIITKRVEVPTAMGGFYDNLEKLARSTSKQYESYNETLEININKEQSLNLPRVDQKKRNSLSVGDLARVPFK
ncbi:hypothetical protein [Exiguobacterium sp. S90]|uniref:hypothetical protein n=1 Tax=Exiguobacterium sp. S90 TaxID=1221231 RepID=UPI001BE7126F|nr:hypothetical protein [Exiguobacterium sp. S90]